MELIKRDIDYNFLAKRKAALFISLTLIAVGVISIIVRGGLNFGLDFTGGTQVELNFAQPVQISEIREVLASINLGNSEIKQFGNPNEILITAEQMDDIGGISDTIIAALRQQFSDNILIVNRVETVGPRIGSELKKDAVYSISIALLLLVIYISIRFQFMFALGAITALVHDVVITLGIFSLFNKEISLTIVAALLTIVGYSLNDTIVVSDRIRENMKLLRREAFHTIVNSSLNQTLSRTIITSLTTLLVVVILFLFGGEIIKDFAFALMIGITVGTYSSIFVATPIVVSLHDRQENMKKLR